MMTTTKKNMMNHDEYIIHGVINIMCKHMKNIQMIVAIIP